MELLCSVLLYGPEQVIFLYGDAGDALYLVAEGMVEVYTHNNARQEIVLETVGSGEVLALCPALTEMLLSGMARRLRTSGDKLRRLTSTR